MPESQSHAVILFESDALDIGQYIPDIDGKVHSIISVPNLTTLRNDKGDSLGLKWMLWVNDFAITEGMRIRYIDIAVKNEDTVSMWVFDNRKDAYKFSKWQEKWAPVYEGMSDYERIYPWLPQEHLEKLQELGLGPEIYKVETNLHYVFFSRTMDKPAIRTWRWINTNCAGRVWYANSEFWFENPKDAATYKMFEEGLRDNG